MASLIDSFSSRIPDFSQATWMMIDQVRNHSEKDDILAQAELLDNPYKPLERMFLYYSGYYALMIGKRTYEQLPEGTIPHVINKATRLATVLFTANALETYLNS